MKARAAMLHIAHNVHPQRYAQI